MGANEANVAVAIVSGLGLIALMARRPTLRGTTLVAPWRWALVSLLSLAAVEIAIGFVGDAAAEWPSKLRFAAAMGTFCPTMALLGAKRPQDRGWQVIVLSLWVILSLPSIEWILFGGISEIHPARFWFLVILVGVGVANGLATRFWLASVFYGAGQVLLLLPFLATRATLSGTAGAGGGTTAIVLCWILLAVGWPRGRGANAPWDRVWLDFRDAYGLVWALRVAERMNASAEMYDWPVRLGWSGFRQRKAATGNSHGVDPQEPDPAVELPRPVADSLRTLLRRFVSPQWIDARLADHAVLAERQDGRRSPTSTSTP